jgi:Fibronectin type III domain
VKGAVWAAVGILALNVLLVGALWITVAVQRYRSERSKRRLEADWHVRTLRSLATRRRIRARRAIRAVLAATIAWAILGSIGVRADRVVTSALSAAVPGSHPSEDLDGRASQATDATDLFPGSVGDPSASGTYPSGSATTPSADDHGAPSMVAATATAVDTIRLQWTDVRSAGGYEVYRSTDGESWVSVGSTEPTVTVYTDIGLTAGTTYYYQVLAVMDGGTAPLSDVVSATTATGLASVATLSATATSSTTIDLTWADVDGETGYRIERSTDGGSSWTTIATTGQDVTTYTDAGLLPATTYSFRVFATDAEGGSPPSEAVLATTAEQQPEQTEPAAANGEAAAALTGSGEAATGSTP